MMTRISTFSRRSVAALLMGTALVSIAAPVLAADAAPQPATEQVEDTGIVNDDIVITARNRAERLQDVPLTVSALSGEQILNGGIRDLKDIAARTPGLVINGGGAESLTRPSIRGLPSTGGDPTVAIFYDGAYLFNPAANNVMFLDMARIEVVKGPVNSLYGRPAYAGAINYISNVPTNHLEGRVLGTIGNDGQFKGQGVINLALVPDVLMIRASAGYEKYDGAWKDEVNGLKQGGFKKRAGQLSALWNITDNITANGRVYYAHDTFDMNPITFMEPNCGVPVTSFAPFQHLSYTCGKFTPNAFEVLPQSQEAGVTGNDRKVLNSFLRLNADVGIGDISSLTTYTDIKQHRFQDFVGRRTGLPFGLVTIPSVVAAGVNALNAPPIVGTIDLPVFFGVVENTTDFAEELRFQSKQDRRFRFTAGLYYAKVTDYQETIAGIDGRAIPAGFTIKGNATTCLLFVCDRTFLVEGPTVSDAATIGRATSTILSGFGGIEFDPLPGLTIAADGRYTSDKRELDSIQSNSAFTKNDALGSVNYIYRPARSVLNPDGDPVDNTFNYFSGRASIRYKFDENVMAYVSVANGVKVGGFNARATHIEEQAYGNETNITYEAGFKSQFLDRKAMINFSAFYIKIKDIQANGPSKFADTAGIIVTNVGGATSKGFELDTQLQPAKFLTVNFGLAYSNATFSDGSYDYSFAATCAQVGPAYCDPARIVTVASPQGNRTAFDLAGLQIPQASSITINTGIDVNVPLANDWLVFGNARYRYQSKQYTGTQNLVWWGPLERVDIRAGFEKGGVRVTAYVDNLFNSKTPDGVGLSSNINDLNFIYQYAQLPFLRRFGVTMEYNF